MILQFISVFTAWLPDVFTLGSIAGFDVDALFVTGIGFFKTIYVDLWWFQTLFHGFVFLMSYYVTMMTLRLFRIIKI